MWSRVTFKRGAALMIPYETIPNINYGDHNTPITGWTYDAKKQQVIMRAYNEIVGYVYFDKTAGCDVMQFKKPVSENVSRVFMNEFKNHKQRYGR